MVGLGVFGRHLLPRAGPISPVLAYRIVFVLYNNVMYPMYPMYPREVHEHEMMAVAQCTPIPFQMSLFKVQRPTSTYTQPHLLRAINIDSKPIIIDNLLALHLYKQLATVYFIKLNRAWVASGSVEHANLS